MKFIRQSMLVAILGCPAAFAQFSDYLGPGVASTGAGTIGQRGGEDVDLRLYGAINAIRDTGLLPFATDADGKIATIKPLYGTEATIGAYGNHSWRRVRLGLDYDGSYRKYTQSSLYDGTNQKLSLGVTYRKSRRIALDSQLSAATVNQGSALGGAGIGIVDSVSGPTSILFDNRYTMVQGSSDLNYIASSKTVYSFGGTGYTIHRGTSALAGVNGYTLRGSVKRRLSRNTTATASYEHMHYDYPRAFGQADINQYSGGIATKLGRNWEVSLSAGVYNIQTQGVESVAIDPAIAALLGTSTTTRTFYADRWLPTVTASFMRKFRRASWTTSFNRSVTPGNGLYLASQEQLYGTQYSYTGFRKWSFSIEASRAELSSIAQQLVNYSATSASVNISRTLPAKLHLGAQYLVRKQELVDNVFNRTATRASINLTYSPGDIPISVH